jgi:hypothetical protein
MNDRELLEEENLRERLPAQTVDTMNRLHYRTLPVVCERYGL